MSKRLSLSRRALQDTDGIADYTLSRWGSRQMEAYVADINAAFLHILSNPGIGRMRHDIRPELRSLPCGRHVIYYEAREEEIEVVRVLHQSQDVQSQIGKSG